MKNIVHLTWPSVCKPRDGMLASHHKITGAKRTLVALWNALIAKGYKPSREDVREGFQYIEFSIDGGDPNFEIMIGRMRSLRYGLMSEVFLCMDSDDGQAIHRIAFFGDYDDECVEEICDPETLVALKLALL